MYKPSFHEWLFAVCDWKISSGMMRGKRYDFEAFPSQLEICRDESFRQVVMKSAQMAVSEMFTLARPFWAVASLGVNWGILFPTQQAMRNFFRTRIKGALAVNPYLRRKTTAENEGNVTAFGHEIFLRYTTTETAIATFDADGATVDEHDMHNQESLFGAETSRTQGAMGDTYWFEVSTPSFPSFGIHKAYLVSDQKVWLIQCEHCGGENNLTERIGDYDIADVSEFFLDYLSEENFTHWRDYIIPCSKCGRGLDPVTPYDRAKPSSGGGRWVARFPDRDVSGYHLQIFQRLYTDGTPAVLRRLRENLVKATDPVHVRRWWNYSLGMPYLSKEGRMTDKDLARVTTTAYNESWAQDFVYRGVYNIHTMKGDWMGVDVRTGQYHIMEFRRISDHERLIVGVGWVKDTTELLEYWRRRGKPIFIIDAMPDTNETRTIVRAIGRRARRATFSRSTRILWQPSGDKDHIIVNRPVAMEGLKSMVESRSLIVPEPAWRVGAGIHRELGTMREEETLRDHFKAPVMVRSYAEQLANEIYDFPKDAMGGIDPHFFMAGSLAYIGSQVQAAPAFALRIPR